uniref:hypothetical protein n=1 Tax=uncultured Caulobacter sp. TaxID=158749 RepID=UPI0025EFC6F3|nr:hypothetical protein [uncultured Caulobacter sp.]
MAERSEQIENLLADVADLVACEYAASAVDRFQEIEGQSGEVRTKATEAIAKAGRAVNLYRNAGRRAGKALGALQRGASAANNSETPMNDDTPRWTPEQIAALHARVRERLDRFAGSRELKYLSERDRRNTAPSRGPSGTQPRDAEAESGPPSPA